MGGVRIWGLKFRGNTGGGGDLVNMRMEDRIQRVRKVQAVGAPSKIIFFI